jgi:hypothetical protein
MRIQIVVDDNYRDMLEELKRATGISQWQDLFSEAITLFNWAVRQRLEGRIVASMDEQEENYRELQMPSLERAAAYGKKHPAAHAAAEEADVAEAEVAEAKVEEERPAFRSTRGRSA